MMNYIESILSIYAFKLGLTVCFVLGIHLLISFLFSKRFRLRILEVSIFHKIKKSVLQSNVNNTKLKLGWIPWSMSIRFDLDEGNSRDSQPSYKLSSRSKFQQLTIFLIPSIVLILIGFSYFPDLISANYTSFYKSYFEILFFKMSIADFNDLNTGALNDFNFVIGLVFLFGGLMTLISNLNIVIADFIPILGLLIMLISIFIVLPLYRLLLYNYTFSNLIYYILGYYLNGFVAYWIIKKLQQELPYY